MSSKQRVSVQDHLVLLFGHMPPAKSGYTITVSWLNFMVIKAFVPSWESYLFESDFSSSF